MGPSDKEGVIPNLVEIAFPGVYLNKTRGFLSIRNSEGSFSKINLNEIGVLIITSPRATLSTALMNTLADRGSIALLCDSKHRPVAYLISLQVSQGTDRPPIRSDWNRETAQEKAVAVHSDCENTPSGICAGMLAPG